MSSKIHIHNVNELEFAVFCIENIAVYLGVDTRQIYYALTEESDILNNYIIAEYEILHTQSKEYIINDIVEVMKEKGVTI